MSTRRTKRRRGEKLLVQNGASICEEVRTLMSNWAERYERRRGTAAEQRRDAGRVRPLRRPLRQSFVWRHGGGRERTIKPHHLMFLRSFALRGQFPFDFPHAKMPELGMLSRALRRLGLSRQARRALSGLRNDADIDRYAPEFLISAYEYGDALAWFDASGVNHDTAVRKTGWARKGSGGCGANNEEHGPNIIGLIDKNDYFMHRTLTGTPTSSASSSTRRGVAPARAARHQMCARQRKYAQRRVAIGHPLRGRHRRAVPSELPPRVEPDRTRLESDQVAALRG